MEVAATSVTPAREGICTTQVLSVMVPEQAIVTLNVTAHRETNTFDTLASAKHGAAKALRVSSFIIGPVDMKSSEKTVSCFCGSHARATTDGSQRGDRRLV